MRAMIFSGLTTARLMAFCFIAFAFPFSAEIARAQISPEIINALTESLVHIRVSGVSASDSSTKTSEGTGFLVSQDGFILTNYHLLDAMEGVDTDTISFSVSFKENSPSFRFKALPVNGNEIVDLLLLKVSETSSAYKPVNLGSADRLTRGARLYTLGFPSADDPDFQRDPLLRDGMLSSRNGPSASLWTMSVPVAAGQSGSPIFLEDGTVVGIAKADSTNDPNSRYMIPIHFADSLLAHLRVASLQRELELVLKALGGAEREPIPLNSRLQSVEKNITDLRKFFNWSAAMVGDDLRIDFSKLVGGEPKLRGIEPHLRPLALDVNKDSKPTGPLRLGPREGPPVTEVPVSNFDDNFVSGYFLLQGIKKKIEDRIESDGDISSIPELDIRIVPVLEDGTKLGQQILIVKTVSGE